MCYGYHRVERPDGSMGWVSEKDLRKLPMWEQAKIRGDGWQFARDLTPVLLSEAEAEALEWVDPKTTPERAAALCRLLGGDHMGTPT